MNIAILTGASSGLGQDFLKALTSCDLDSIWIIARRAERLDSLASAFPHKNIIPLPLDITSKDDLIKLENKLKEEKPEVRLLINNAGKGLLSDFVTADGIALSESIALNCNALTLITRLTLPYMKKGSAVINVSSIASFAPTSRMAVYGATKSYVTSFSRALREELKPRGINVTVVCPGPMKTEFLPVAKIEKGKSTAFDYLPYCNPERVAKNAIKSAIRGKAVYTPTAFYKFYRLLAKILPHALVVKFAKT